MSDLSLRVDEMLMKQDHLKAKIDLMMKQLKRANDLYAQGREDERKAIVEWLRQSQGSVLWHDEDGHNVIRWDGNDFANDIEQGVHLEGDDE